MDIFGIKRRKAQKDEEMHKTYKERKAHYEDIWYNEDVSSSDISYMMHTIYDNVRDLREKKYDRQFDSLDEIVNNILTLTRLTQTIHNRDTISIDIIEILMKDDCRLVDRIGSYRFDTCDKYFYKITDKDVLAVLDKLGFKRHFNY